MIPLRITVEGFLCYRTRQALGFEEAALWMLAGPNGSGKSTIFDAITFALFGHHRGGQRNARELINKHSSRLLVEFEFLHEEQAYQARRTLKRKGNPAGTWQVRRWRPPVEGDGQPGWEEVPDTSTEVGFDRWVRNQLGLTYETFTSSVLLLQGKADNLLAAVPAKRFEVLAGVVGLDRYQRLHERADERRKDLLGEARTLQHQLHGTREIPGDELWQAEQKIGLAERLQQEARDEVQRLQALEFHAVRWTELQATLAGLRRQWQEAQDLLAEADAIERDGDRLRRLREVLPHLGELLDWRRRLDESHRTSHQLAAERQGLEADRQALDTALEAARRQQGALHRAIADDEQCAEAVGARLRVLSGLLAQVSLCAKQRAELTRLGDELRGLPPHPDEARAREQEAHDRLAVLARTLPYLDRLHAEREALRQARERARRAAAEERAASARAEQLAADCAQLAGRRAAAAEVRQQADERATEARTLLQESRKQWRELHELSGAKVCRHCGQALTPGHLREEQVRRQKELDVAENRFRQADHQRQAAVREETRCLAAERQAQDGLAEAQEQARQGRRDGAEAERAAQRHGDECGRAYRELGEPFRSRVQEMPPLDWLATLYPTGEDLNGLRHQVEDLETGRRRVDAARQVCERWNALHVRLDTTREALATQEAGLPADAADLPRQHAALEAEEGALQQRLRDQRRQRNETQECLDQLGRQRDGLLQQIGEKARRLAEEDALRGASERARVRARDALPPDWRWHADTDTPADDLAAWRAELDALEARGTAARVEHLHRVRAGLESLRLRNHDLEREQDLFPEAARCDPEQVRQRLATARQQQTVREGELQQARQDRALLELLRDQRQQLEGRLLAAERQHKLYDTLARLLGRDRLQLYLVRQAERGIVEYANTVLGRLSGGELYLRLSGDPANADREGAGGDKALQLEVINRHAGPDPIRIEFLSGSQRFRVAVSLALGIGQYASRRHRPVESVIIDEGFGCLDKANRQVMIQELQNLRGQLRCILVVSHQDEFATAFADGYQFELSNGTTEVARFQR
jgi:DNA repair exonuclease SbcCD ATPase subunit